MAPAEAGLGPGRPVADASLHPGRPAPAVSVSTSELAASLRQNLVARLEPLVAGLGGGRILVDAHALERARRCPAQLAAPAEPFAWSARLVRRRLGVEALRSLLEGRCRAPGEAVRFVEARLVAAGRAQAAGSRSLEAWFASLAPGARASAVAAGTTWATAAWAELSAGGLGLVGAGTTDDWTCPGRPPVTLRGRAELRAWVGDGKGPRRQAVVAVAADAPGPGSEARLAFLALAATLATGRPPERAVALHPEAGSRRVLEVTEAALRAAADEAVEAVAALAAARRARQGALERRPGRHCGWCAQRDGCAEGAAWSAGEGRRRYGILPLG